LATSADGIKRPWYSHRTHSRLLARSKPLMASGSVTISGHVGILHLLAPFRASFIRNLPYVSPVQRFVVGMCRQYEDAVLGSQRKRHRHDGNRAGGRKQRGEKEYREGARHRGIVTDRPCRRSGKVFSPLADFA